MTSAFDNDFKKSMFNNCLQNTSLHHQDNAIYVFGSSPEAHPYSRVSQFADPVLLLSEERTYDVALQDEHLSTYQ